MFRWVLKLLWRLTLVLGTLGLAGLLLPRLITSLHALNRIHQKADAPARGTAIVFGAGLRRDGSPTAILRDRVATAAELYLSGQVTHLLMSGDGQSLGYNEPDAMRQYAILLGVPDQAISVDYAGQRTYDSCYRAKAVFGLTDVLLVTQRFHLPRALFLCNGLGLDALGVEANNHRYWSGSMFLWNIREQLATVGAFWDLYVSSPNPVLSGARPRAVD